MAIATTTSDPMFTSTPFTCETHVTDFASATTGDGSDDFAMAERNVRSMLLKVSRCVLPEAVGDRGHGRLTLKNQFDLFTCVGLSRIGQVEVHHGGLQAGVAKVLLNDFQ